MADLRRRLLHLTAEALSVGPDEIGCDDCSVRLPAYAEVHVRRRRLGAELRAVADHLDRCPACREEWDRLQKSLRTTRRRGKI
jgi:hypothetical protein